MSPASLIILASWFVSAPALADPPRRAEKTADPQYVLISFDNSNGIAEWKRSRALAARSGAKFTYFLSCVFLIPKDRRASYSAPGFGQGKSNIGFAPSREDVSDRLRQIWTARKEGHEIGSHACGHFDGKAWSKADWLEEFGSFRTVLREGFRANGIDGEPEGWREFATHQVRGFRAPYLSTNAALFRALEEDGFAFDASGVSRGPAQPDRKGAIARFALPLIPEGPKERRVLAMDYNLFVRHTDAQERPDHDGAFEERAIRAFHNALDKQMNTDRQPLELGFHFTMMNGGAYWRALERFAAEACVRPDVACVTYSDYLARTAGGSASKDELGG